MTRWRVGLAWLALLASLTGWRVPLFTDEARLWTEAAEWAPAKVRPQVNLGRLAQLRGDPITATAHYERARALARASGSKREHDTGWAVATTNLALLKAQTGDLEGARRLVSDVQTYQPTFRGVDAVAVLVNP